MLNSQVEQLLANHITPLELFYTEIRDTISSARTRAYKTDVLVRSMPLGDLLAADYQPTANRTNLCIALSMWALSHLCREVTALIEAEQDMDFYSVHIPLRFIEKADMEATLNAVFEAEEFKYRDKIMLEFPPEAIYLDTEVLNAAIKGAKSAGVQCMLTGVGSENYPIIRLASLPQLEIVQMHESVAENFRDEDAEVTAAALITYLRSLSLKIIVPGVGVNDDRITAGLERLGCFGIITPNPERYNLQYMLDEIARERGELYEATMQSYSEQVEVAPQPEAEPVGADVPDGPQEAVEEIPTEETEPEAEPEEQAPITEGGAEAEPQSEAVSAGGEEPALEEEQE